METSETTKSSNLNFFNVLTIAFIVLRLTGHIDWKWLWVLSPMWAPFMLYLLSSFVLFLSRKAAERTKV